MTTTTTTEMLPHLNSSVMYETFWVTYYSTSQDPDSLRSYHVYPLTDKILSVILAVLAVPGVLMNIMVLWCLFRRAGNLNTPTRQLHGHMMVANTILLLVCVPAISITLFKGRPNFKNSSLHVAYEHDPIFCNISGYIFSAMIRMIIHVSTVLSIDRVMAVQCPLFHKYKVQKWGYNLILTSIWFLNLLTMTTPFIQGSFFRNMVYECICNWKALDEQTGIISKDSPAVNTLSLLFFFGIPFCFTNLITIICCVWVIVVVLMKNVKVERLPDRVPTDGYQLMATRRNGEPGEPHDHQGPEHLESPLNGGRKTSYLPKSMVKVGQSLKRKLPSQVAKMRKKTSGIRVSADSRVKRACETMLIVIVVQLICYSVIQVMMLDAFFRYAFYKNLFTINPDDVAASIIFTNYPIPLVLFSIIIPFVIYFRMIRQESDSTRSSKFNSTRLSFLARFQSQGKI